MRNLIAITEGFVPDNQEDSLADFMATKAEFDHLLAELKAASDDHFGADPEATVWGEAEALKYHVARLRDIADALYHRGEYTRGV